MENLVETLKQYGQETELAQGRVLIRQGSVSDGMYYLKSGCLGIYREELDDFYLLSIVAPGEIVGEIGDSTGRSHTATVMAAEESCIIHISEEDFLQAINEVPDLAAEVIHIIGNRLTDANNVRIVLGQSYRQAVDRVQKLSTQKAQLEELLRLREELADMIVHDLRSPLGAISTALDLLQQVPVVDAEVEYVTAVTNTMGQSIQRMQYLVDTLLDIARLEEGQMTLWLQPLDLYALVEALMAEEHLLARKSGVALKNCIPADLPLVMADHDVLERVMVNLLDNALRFTPREGKVWVDAYADESMVRVKVVDTGPGIPQEERIRIFEKFTQIQGRAGTQRGAGLGLPFCRMATNAHGGRIWVEDGPKGKGNCMVFTLPQTQEAAII
ncbi:MAG: cyclic nucleotide-binding domain-containing protein [Chloroflexi bacterium]|nr:cyclic nucleotide-binding domain-containing protein [Chloroflexota bacterium]